MKLFETALGNFWILGMEWDDESQKFLYSIRKNFYSYTVSIMCITLTIIYLIRDAQKFEEYTEALFVCTTAAMCSIITTFMSIKLGVFSAFIKDANIAYKERIKYPDSKRIFDEATEMTEKWSKIVTFVTRNVCPLCGVLSRAVPSFFYYFTTDLGNEAFELPVKMWFPFDWRNPLGYLVACLIQVLAAFYGFVLVSALVPLAIGGFSFAIALIKDMKLLLHSINKCAKVDGSSPPMTKHLFEFIQYHSGMTQLIKYFSEAYQPIIATLFAWSLITGSGCLLMIQLQISNHDTDLFVITVMILETVSAFGLVGFSCEIGQQFTTEFDSVGDTIDKLRWYKFPLKLQQLLPIVILIAQQELAIECFGSISCLRTSFKSVTNTAFSYFMVLRQFDI